MIISKDKFNFFVPVELVKGTKTGQEMYIKGICSSEVEDSDGETLLPAGFDVSALLATGFLNYNHQAGKTASAIIGEPTKAEIVNNGKDLYLEGFLYADSDEAKAVYKLAQTLEKNSSKRRLGFSIEGKALEKDPLNPKRITKARITGVAITAMPKNPNTLLSIMKGEYEDAFVTDEIEKSEINIEGLVKEFQDWNSSSKYSVESVQEFLENNHEDHIDLKEKLFEEINKAMTAEAGDRVTSKESVEGGIKTLDMLTKEKENEIKKLKKSEVYNKIFERYGNDINQDIKKAKQIYQLTQEFNIKLYNMTGEETISKALENTFEFIDQHIGLLKGESAEGVTKEEVAEETIQKSEEELAAEAKVAEDAAKEAEIKKSEEEAELKKSQSVDSFGLALTSFVKSELEKGESQESVIEGLVSKGLSAEFSTNLVKGCVEEMNGLKENGSLDSTQVSAAIQKSEDGSDLIKAEQVELIKSEILGQFEKAQVNILSQIETRFKALGGLMKSQGDEITILKSENQTLSSALQTAQQNINLIAHQPVGTRSIVKSTQIERFQNNDIQKSNTGKDVYNLQKGDDVVALTQRLSDEFDIIKSNGQKNTPLENALFEMSVAKSMDRHTLASVKPTLDRMNIEIA